jgi:hypothetical protein
MNRFSHLWICYESKSMENALFLLSSFKHEGTIFLFFKKYIKIQARNSFKRIKIKINIIYRSKHGVLLFMYKNHLKNLEISELSA